MKKIIYATLILVSILSGSQIAVAQNKSGNNRKSQEIIIMKNGDSNEKLTIETKDGKTLINGKPASEYKGNDVTIINGNDGNNFVYTPKSGMRLFGNGGNWGNNAFLGVNTEREDNGVRITEIIKGSAAEKYGLKEGDIIKKIGDKKIEDPNELMETIRGYKPKDEIKLYYERNGRTNDTRITLGENKDSFSGFSFNDSAMGMNKELMQKYDQTWSRDFNNNFKNDFKFNMRDVNVGPHPLMQYFTMGRARLGVRIEDTDNDTGAKITNVEEESVAEKAGLKKEDIITEVDGKKVKDVNEVRKELAGMKERSSYSIKVRRNNSEMNFEIKIPKRINNADL
ncbi:MAG: PDZ domain-containing protein [Chitinophagaceae bacterium]|nr:PDZ domain-containing protein [Chitinophagaceae bacterium]